MVESGKQLIPHLRRTLERVDGVRCAYLFGSRARAGARTDSDLDIAYHIVASKRLPQPSTAFGAFETLAAQGLLEDDLAARLGGAASLRDVPVHDYVDVDLDLLATAVRDDLGDLAAFDAAVARLLEEEDPRVRSCR